MNIQIGDIFAVTNEKGKYNLYLVTEKKYNSTYTGQRMDTGVKFTFDTEQTQQGIRDLVKLR